MDKETIKEKKGTEPMKQSSNAQKPVESFTGTSIINYLTETMGVSRTMVAALLDVTERTLLNWSTQSVDELSTSGSKSKRLVALYDFIIKAEKLKVPKSAMVSLLQDPIQPEDEHSNTPMYFIIEEPESSCLKSTGDLIIQNFLKS
jgi:hypothetical protein